MVGSPVAASKVTYDYTWDPHIPMVFRVKAGKVSLPPPQCAGWRKEQYTIWVDGLPLRCGLMGTRNGTDKRPQTCLCGLLH